MGGVELHLRNKAGEIGSEFQKKLFWNGLHVKFTSDTGIVAPMFIFEKRHIDELIEKFQKTLDQFDK